MSKCVVVHKGEAFASQGLGKFAKDIVHLGEWVHPVTGRKVSFDKARLDRLLANVERYLKAGNKIPFPDGHSFDAMKNLGEWPGPFLVHRDRLVGVVEPKAAGVAEKLADGSIDSVSAMIEFDVTDSKGNRYDEVITHICATPYPVITEQKEFVKLSRDLDASAQAEVLLPAELLGPGKPKPGGGDEEEDDGDEDDDEGEEEERRPDLRLAAKAFQDLAGASKPDLRKVGRACLETLGIPGGDMKGCVQVMMQKRGIPKESAQRICSVLARREGAC